MSALGEVTPAPGRAVDWQEIDARFAWFRALYDCPQDPVFHAEGDVGRHTRLVVEALIANPAWQALVAEDRAVVFWAALLHDIAKPATTRVTVDGRVAAPGHSRRGSIMARTLLWEMGVPFARRELIAHLVTHHQVPFHLIEREAPQRRLYAISHQARCDLLALLAEADARGREAPDVPRLLDNIALFAEMAREEGCLHQPRAFAGDHTRFLYFREAWQEADVPAWDDWWGPVTVLSGLPAAGKDSWAAGTDQPILSLDRLRVTLGIDPGRDQGPLIQAAREQARKHLRERQPFIWNATNLSRQVRGQVIDLIAAYRARVRLVYVETDPASLDARNRARSEPVPQAAIDRMLTRWEPPDLTECHGLEIAIT